MRQAVGARRSADSVKRSFVENGRGKCFLAKEYRFSQASG